VGNESISYLKEGMILIYLVLNPKKDMNNLLKNSKLLVKISFHPYHFEPIWFKPFKIAPIVALY